MTIPEAAKRLNLSEQLLRVWCQQKNGCPFGEVIRSGKRKSYYISEERLNNYLKGGNVNGSKEV